ncbi:hypothetical protein FMM75_17095 [Lachnospiraceae bacterium MD335]|nr:hypothetical protein [Lachnospiraceae bacterium MD335]
MGNSLLAVRGINHKYIVVGGNKDEFRKQLIESVDFDVDLKEIEHVIESVSEEKQKEIDWTKLWSKKYPILSTYQKEVQIDRYAAKLQKLLDSLKTEYRYNEENAFLVLKDILAQVWNVNHSLIPKEVKIREVKIGKPGIDFPLSHML